MGVRRAKRIGAGVLLALLVAFIALATWEPFTATPSPAPTGRAYTAEIIRDACAPGLRICLDERLREKEFGLLDRLTRAGIAERFPELHEQRAHVGKFYFRPPGGESWCDVILRLRSVMEMWEREYAGCRLLVVAHQVIVNCLRYLLEELDEARILEIDRRGDVPNCSITAYERATAEGGREALRLSLCNFVAPLRREGTPVTRAPDEPAAPSP